jgi:hypothetical protein
MNSECLNDEIVVIDKNSDLNVGTMQALPMKAPAVVLQATSFDYEEVADDLVQEDTISNIPCTDSFYYPTHVKHTMRRDNPIYHLNQRRIDGPLSSGQKLPQVKDAITIDTTTCGPFKDTTMVTMKALESTQVTASISPKKSPGGQKLPADFVTDDNDISKMVTSPYSPKELKYMRDNPFWDLEPYRSDTLIQD